MRADAHENHRSRRAAIVQAVRQQKIAADVAFAMAQPTTAKRMVAPLRPQGRIVGDQQQHRFLEPVQIVAARMAQPLPVLDEALGVIR